MPTTRARNRTLYHACGRIPTLSIGILRRIPSQPIPRGTGGTVGLFPRELGGVFGALIVCSKIGCDIIERAPGETCATGVSSPICWRVIVISQSRTVIGFLLILTFPVNVFACWVQRFAGSFAGKSAYDGAHSGTCRWLPRPANPVSPSWMTLRKRPPRLLPPRPLPFPQRPRQHRSRLDALLVLQ